MVVGAQTSSISGRCNAPSHAEALEPFRKYLEVLARAPRSPASRQARPLRRGPADDAAGLRGPGRVRGAPEVLAAWLRKILARTLADTVKHYERDRRDVDLERSLEADLDRSSPGSPPGWPPTRRRRARPPNATRNCCALSTPWPSCPSRCARSSSSSTARAGRCSRSPSRSAGPSRPSHRFPPRTGRPANQLRRRSKP